MEAGECYEELPIVKDGMKLVAKGAVFKLDAPATNLCTGLADPRRTVSGVHLRGQRWREAR